mgnify:CR=1 FL=1
MESIKSIQKNINRVTILLAHQFHHNLQHKIVLKL